MNCRAKRTLTKVLTTVDKIEEDIIWGYYDIIEEVAQLQTHSLF